MIMRLIIPTLIRFWPVWAWAILLNFTNSSLEGTQLYLAGQVIVTCLLAWTIFIITPYPRLGSKLVWLGVAASLVAGIYGLQEEWERWEPWWQANGAMPLFTVLHANHSLVLASLLSFLSAPVMLFSQNIATWLSGYKQRLRNAGNDAHGSARWMTPAQRQKRFPPGEAYPGQKLIVGEACDPEKESDKIGKSPLLLYDIDGKGHAITVGPTRMGKTRGLVSSNLLHWARSVVCLDLKGDLSPEFAPSRRKMGREVYTLDVNAADGNTDSINVLEWLDPSARSFVSDARTVASWLAGDDPKNDSNPAFRGNAKDLIHLGILEVITNPQIPKERKTLLALKQFLDQTTMKEALEEISSRNQTANAVAAAGLALGFLAVMAAGDTWGGVMFDKNAMTAWLAQPSLRCLVSGEPEGNGRCLSLDEINSGKTDIFVSLSLDVLEATPELPRLIFGSLLSSILRHARKNRRTKNRTLFLLDEMPRFGYMKILETARDAGSPHIILWPFIQNPGQLTDSYGDRAIQSWMANSEIRNFIATSDMETAKYVSEWLGTETVEQLMSSKQGGQSFQAGQLGGGTSSGQSVNTQLFGRPLRDPSQVMNFRKLDTGGTDEQYLFLRGCSPLHCTLPFYDRHPALIGKL